MNHTGHSHTHAPAAPATQGRTIRWAHQYDFVVKLLLLGRENTLREETIRRAGLPANAAVLDVGCGTGTLTLLAKARVGAQGKVVGLDAAPEMIGVAQQKAAQQKRDVDFQVGVIEAMPFPDCTFDVVLSSLMFHHLPGDLKRRGLAEIFRVLKPGGHLLIVDIRRPATRMQRFTMALLAHAGMNSGIQDALPLIKQAGFVGIQEGTMPRKLIGSVRAQRPTGG